MSMVVPLAACLARSGEEVGTGVRLPKISSSNGSSRSSAGFVLMMSLLLEEGASVSLAIGEVVECAEMSAARRFSETKIDCEKYGQFVVFMISGGCGGTGAI
jgi:hypothetical protein